MVTRVTIIILFATFSLAACSPEVGSDAWCRKMDDKPTGDWTANEAGEYAKSCIFRSAE